MPSACAVATTSSHCAAGQLALGEHPADLVVEDLRGGAGIEPRPASRSSVSHSSIDTPALAAAADDLHRGERVHVHVRHRGLHRADQVGVEGDRQLRVDAALHADLGGPVGGGLDGPRGDLVEREPERVGVALALGERAEPAADVADVREVDVAVDDVGDLVADDVAAQVVGGAGQLLQRRALRQDQRHRRVVVGGVEQRRGAGRGEVEPGADVGVEPGGRSGGTPLRLAAGHPARGSPWRARCVASSSARASQSP
jgi:hypothetical protein